MSDLILVRGARQLLTLAGPDEPRRGSGMDELHIINDGSVLIKDGVITQVGPTRRIERLAESRKATVIDAAGKVVMPGFVDGQTCLVSRASAATRQRMGIEARTLLREFVRQGTTTLDSIAGEAMVGSNALRVLRLLEELDEHPLAVTPSYRCPAGAKLLSTIHRRGIARLIEVEVGQSGARSMLAAARHLGFYVRLVTTGTVSVEAAMLAIEFDACALGGFSSIDPRALALLAESNVVATLLPGRDFAQGAGHYPPARDMIARNVPVAIATGFDSCAPSTCSMPAVIAIACSQMRLTPAEAITAATWNASCALALQHRTGSLTAGKQADLLVLHCSDYRDLATRFGINPVSMVVRRGELIYPRMGGR